MMESRKLYGDQSMQKAVYGKQVSDQCQNLNEIVLDVRLLKCARNGL